MNSKFLQKPRRQRMTVGIVLPLLLVLVTALFSAPVAAQEMQPVIDRMDRLERDIRALNIQLSGQTGGNALKTVPGAPAPAPVSQANPAMARLGVRLTDLENDLRKMTGTIENLGFRVNQISERLDKLVSDIDFRLTALETAQGGKAVAGQTSAAPAPGPVQTVDSSALASQPGTLGTVSEKAVAAIQSGAKNPALNTGQPINPPAAQEKPGVLPAGTPREQYNYASGLLRQTKYKEAEIALKEFIALHRDSPLAGNARYWLGETYYVRNAYDEAAKIFFEGYQAAPKGAKALDMLLKLGMSLAGLGDKKNACITFNKVLKDFPGATGTVRKKIEREQKRNGCG